jgi:signal transduction histidine kinase/ligand-binding sensor domain-containing protein
MAKAQRRRVVWVGILLASCNCTFALNPSLDITQYAHTAWTVRDGFSLGNIYAIAQTPDGYLWLGTEFGLFRFDGVRSIPLQPPAGQELPDRNINCLLVTRDGTLWIGTFAGLTTWSGGKMIRRALPGAQFVASLFEDREGTVWAGMLGAPGLLCAMRSGGTQCYGEDGAFGRAVWALYEDRSGTLWAGAQSGLWRMRPGPRRRYATRTELIALNKFDDGRLLIAMHDAGLMQLAGDKVESYRIRDPMNPNRLLRDHEIDSNRVLRDRDGGLWIGTVERGLIHLHHGRTDIFTKSDGLSGDVVLSLFEDREGNVWTASTGGLDRFRELPVTTVSVKQGLSSDATQSVLAAIDGSIWIGAHEGLSRWKNGQITIFGEASGLPDNAPESLFQDDHGRIWVSTRHGVAYFKDGRFVALNAVRGGEVHYITGDSAGNLWLSEHRSLLHLLDGRLVEQIPWSALGRQQSAELLLSDRQQGGLWLGFWVGGGLAYFKDGRFRVRYTAADGLGAGNIPGLQLDPDGTLWAATQKGGVSRIKDGRIATLTTRNGLPCNTIHWTIEDDDRSLWLYTACGLVRITHSQLQAWIADPKRRVEMTVWDAADGVRLRSSAASAYGPRVAKSTDGKIWFVTGEGVQVVDPHHLAFNKIPPPVRVEQIMADHKRYWQNLAGAAVSNVHLPPRTRDLQIDYTALSLVAPEKVHFKYKLEGQDQDWREVVNDRDVQYSNLRPGPYWFRVMASNNSGVWNEAGASLDFSIDPAYYQTNWFRGLCAAAFLILLWMIYRTRVRQLARDFNLRLEERVNERTRIARELHDTLLQSVQASLVQMQVARTLVSRQAERAVGTLDQAISMTEGAIADGRDAIRELRSQSPVHANLAKLLTLTGQELASEQNTEGKQAAVFRTTVEGEKRSMKPLIQDEAYRIGRELLRNAFRHADASEIEAAIRYEDRLFRLRVRDNGKGIDAKILKAGSRTGHWGLLGIRERAKRIGGQLDIWSQTGAGTEVELSIPGAIAYEAAQYGRRPFALFHRKRAQS